MDKKMSRKILLSFLGTNNYLGCNYYLEGRPDQKISNVKYVQQALVQLFCKDFSEQVFLVLNFCILNKFSHITHFLSSYVFGFI